MKSRKVVFLTGTRADYGKLKSLMCEIKRHKEFELHIFVTGMHMLSKYGSTYMEVEKDGFDNIYKFVNTKINQGMDITLSNTILGFSNYVSEYQPDLIVVHGDRVEALAGAIVGALNNIKVAHIEGGEVSGTIDESIRHAITKFAHIHLVSNEEAKKRIIQLGEREDSVFVIGSPDIDIMFSDFLPTLEEVKEHYDIEFEEYGILMYHPVTTELDKLKKNVSEVVDAVINSEKNYIVVYPNNDEGSNTILDEFERFKDNKKFKCFPSIRFESFLTLLKYSLFMIGNSSAGIREASVYGIPSIDIGSRQEGRYDPLLSKSIVHVNEDSNEICKVIKKIKFDKSEQYSLYGKGKSFIEFMKVMNNEDIWIKNFQKKFIPFISQTQG
ncbi:UDP-N-acetylglucosamine 2-epimerase [Pseudobacillus sp. FSL P4-0506]|uniref:UDP-N-acetylglucosamine 2-epimerase n=1 Tax=Pseudobacillus sp. FSL P4-0506 TaxID=2921576 RepID=UPI0030F98D49